jgi:hypothetical protein
MPRGFKKYLHIKVVVGENPLPKRGFIKGGFPLINNSIYIFHKSRIYLCEASEE